MGLDLYVGPLCRYLSGDWELKAARVAREVGMTFRLIRAPDAPTLLDREEALSYAEYYQIQLTDELEGHVSSGIEWNEGFELPYWTEKPDHSGRMALILWAAYLRYPEFKRPTVLPALLDEDPAYDRAYSERKINDVFVLDSHLYVPSNEVFHSFAADPFGEESAISSTAALRRALESTNAKSWQAPQERIDVWERNGLPSTNKYIDGKVIDVEPVIDPLERSAQFAFAVYSKALAFSDAHRVPIVLDE